MMDGKRASEVDMASHRATVTSITSILERSVPPARSEDRLSFQSVSRDYLDLEDELQSEIMVCVGLL